MAGIGARVERREDARLLTGRGRYVADIARPHMVTAVMVRSPHAHARIRAIDTRAARAHPGVLAGAVPRDGVIRFHEPAPNCQ